MAPGGSVTVSIPGGKLPAGFTSASGLYIYAVLDIGGTGGETNKSNNTAPAQIAWGLPAGDVTLPRLTRS